MTEEPAAGPIDLLTAQIRVSKKRLKKTPIDSWDALNRELRFNVYSTMEAICDQIAEVDDVIQEVVEMQESYLQPETAAQLFKSFALGELMVEEIKKLIPTFDDVTAKRWNELITEYEKETELAVMIIQDAIEDPGPGEGDEDEDESESEDGDDDSDGDDEEKTPVEIPVKPIAEEIENA
jgi:hypothetical protein